jgi:N-acetylmuramoyl-L-alanine amidase
MSISRRSFLQILAQIPVWVTLPSGVVAAARLRVQALRHWPEPERTRLVLDLSAAARFEAHAEKDPPRIVLRILSADLSQSIDQRFAGEELVERVRARPVDDGVELVIDLKRPCELNSFPLEPNEAGKGHRIVLDVSPRLSEHEQAAATAERLSRIEEVRRSGDRIVALDAGHGGEDPGTVWGRSLREKDIALEVAKLLEKRLHKQSGLRPVMTRTGDYFVPLARRQQIAREFGADTFVSLHVNAAGSKQARGVEIYFLSLKGAVDKAARELIDRENAADIVGGVTPEKVQEPIVDILMGMKRDRTMKESERLAEILLRRMLEVGETAARGVKQGPLAVLKSIDKPSVLVELGFFTNPTDRKLLANSRTLDGYSRELARGIVDYLA